MSESGEKKVFDRKEKRRAWLYVRSEKGSLAAQMDDLKNEAGDRGLIPVGSSQDVRQGRRFCRRGLHEMMDAVRSGKAECVLVGSVGQLSHDNTKLMHILCFLQGHGAVLVTTETDVRYELSIRGLERKLQSRAARKGRGVPW